MKAKGYDPTFMPTSSVRPVSRQKKLQYLALQIICATDPQYSPTHQCLRAMIYHDLVTLDVLPLLIHYYDKAEGLLD